MTTYTVIATIQSKDTTNPPVDVQHYRGDNLAVALSAMSGAATLYQEPSEYSHVEPDVLAVRIDFVDDPAPVAVKIPLADVIEAAQNAADAAEGDSNDDEITALRVALDTALDALGLDMPEAREDDE